MEKFVWTWGKMPRDILFRICCLLEPIWLWHLCHSSRVMFEYLCSDEGNHAWYSSMPAAAKFFSCLSVARPELRRLGYMAREGLTQLVPLPPRYFVRLLGKPFDAAINYKRELIGALAMHRVCHDASARRTRYCFVCFRYHDTTTGETRLQSRFGMLWCPQCIREYFICKSPSRPQRPAISRRLQGSRMRARCCPRRHWRTFRSSR